MQPTLNKLRMGISAGACILLALMLLVLPLQWIAAIMVAGLFHELCHLLAVYLCRGKIRRCYVCGRGAVMEAEPMTPARELICVLGGPIGGLLLLSVISWFPRLALCGVFHSLYNLLPLNGLDGGAALLRIAWILFPGREGTICLWVQRGCMAILWGLAIYASFVLRIGFLPLAAVLLLHMKTKWKNPLQILREEGTIIHSFQ